MSGRGRPKLDPKAAVSIWVLIEAYRAPMQAGGREKSVLAASKKLADEYAALGWEKRASREGLRDKYKQACALIKSNPLVHDDAIRMAAELIAWKREIGVTKNLIPLFVAEYGI